MYPQAQVDLITSLVANAGGLTALSAQMGNNKGGVCAGLCAEFLSAAITPEGNCNPDFRTMVFVATKASRGVSGTQLRANQGGSGHKYFEEMQDARAKSYERTEHGELDLAADYSHLAELYAEMLAYDNDEMGYSAQQPDMAGLNVLHGIESLPQPGRMLVTLSWKDDPIPHAIAIAKDIKGNVMIYDPNVGAVSLPPGSPIVLHQVVEAYMEFNRLTFSKNMSAKVKPLKNPMQILTEIADLEGHIRNVISVRRPATFFKSLTRTLIRDVSEDVDVAATILAFRNQVLLLDADEFCYATKVLALRCHEIDRTATTVDYAGTHRLVSQIDILVNKAIWALATHEFAVLVNHESKPINSVRMNELVNTVMNSATIQATVHLNPQVLRYIGSLSDNLCDTISMFRNRVPFLNVDEFCGAVNRLAEQCWVIDRGSTKASSAALWNAATNKFADLISPFHTSSEPHPVSDTRMMALVNITMNSTDVQDIIHPTKQKSAAKHTV